MAVTESGHLASREIDDLYRAHVATVYRYAYAVLGNHADAEDITQTTFLNAYRALEQGVKPRKPSSWLLTIASNAIKQRFRQEQSRPRQVELDERLVGATPDDDEERPTVGELLTALSKIPPQQRQAIVLREFEGRSYVEIAEILGVTTSALETLLFRARRSLAEELEHQLTCTDAQLAISRSADGRLGRKERRRLRDHLAECPDCARFARLQQRHRSALRGLALIPIPLSLSLFKGFEGTATAAVIPIGAATSAAAMGTGASAVAVGAGVGTGATAAGATGGLLAGGVGLKVAAVVAAASVAGGVGVVGSGVVTERPSKKQNPAAEKPGARLGQTAPRGVLVPGNGVAQGKTTAPGQTKTDRSAADIARSGARGQQAKTSAPGRTVSDPRRDAAKAKAATAKSKAAVPNSRAASARTKSATDPKPTGQSAKVDRDPKTSTIQPTQGERPSGTQRSRKLTSPPESSGRSSRKAGGPKSR